MPNLEFDILQVKTLLEFKDVDQIKAISKSFDNSYKAKLVNKLTLSERMEWLKINGYIN